MVLSLTATDVVGIVAFLVAPVLSLVLATVLVVLTSQKRGDRWRRPLVLVIVGQTVLSIVYYCVFLAFLAD